jgi:aerobic carbon-monoxide dehydrogenase medium subunit
MRTRRRVEVLAPFDLHRATSVAEASALLAAHGPEAAVYAGGTELLAVMKERLLEPALLVDIKPIPGLGGIALDPDGRRLRIGALARHREIERDPLVRLHLPAVAAMAAQVANVRVRCAGTIGGNLCFAEPHSDPATLLLALDGVVALDSGEGSRRLPIGDFFVGFLTTARQPAEILTAVEVPLPPPGTGVAYERFKTHERPSASVAARLTLRRGVVAEPRLAVGCVGERPVRIAAAEALLAGAPPSPELFAAAGSLVADGVEPTEDGFESTDYKRHLARTLAIRALTDAARAANGGSHAG